MTSRGDGMNQNRPRHFKKPSINSSEFAVDPSYYNINSSDSDLLNTTSDNDTDSGTTSNENEISNGNSGREEFDPVSYLIFSLQNSLNSIEMDKSIVKQSQLSGELNNKTKELLKSYKESQEKLKEFIVQFGHFKNEIIPNLEKDLAWSENKVKKLNKKLREHYPIEYEKSKDKVLNRITNDEEDLFV
ncbi:hypothetical protein PACTADRAFT_50143 [Pachysolen tannophilus NRRL Y-2460]|uniref:Biogenesis of lysosome-related organelles complex 1 subunit KXD1 n=1 Tax=Pachysolen tannophilus NRRL Y-2460 TaxID=669874 RepID=A0A1E4TUL4_PACTA|nr:hypothetical protein PACTADRAFT_50143 [Pachysolen tannophilus NRRL Y-2460]